MGAGTHMDVSHLIRVLEAVASHRIPREDASQWARSCGGGYGEPNPFADARYPQIVSGGLLALKAATTSVDLMSEGEPYFIRDSDYFEWASTLRGDATSLVAGGVRPIRPHELQDAQPALILLGVNPENMAERLGVVSLRGLDDLDYTESVPFEGSGQKFALTWYPRSPAPTEAVVHAHRSADLRVVGHLLMEILDLAPGAVAPFASGA